MLTYASFRGFKALADVELDLEPLTVLVGPNASGKSTVLEGLDYVLQLAWPFYSNGARKAPSDMFQGPRAFDQLRTRPDASEMRLEVHALGGLVHGVVARGDPDGEVTFKIITADGEVDARASAAIRLELRDLASVVRLRFSLEQLMADSVPSSSEPVVENNGEGLASALAYIIGLRDGRIEAIEDGFHRVVPIAKRIRCVKARLSGQQGLADRFEVELAGIGWLPPSALSEGTLLALALLCVLHGPARPKTVLLDDLDRALHPRAQASIIAVIRGVQRAAGGIQVICTSHSPYLLDCLEPQEVRIMKVTDSGLALCRKLTDHPDWEKWKGSMRPGEFWGSVGEDWIV